MDYIIITFMIILFIIIAFSPIFIGLAIIYYNKILKSSKFFRYGIISSLIFLIFTVACIYISNGLGVLNAKMLEFSTTDQSYLPSNIVKILDGRLELEVPKHWKQLYKISHENSLQVGDITMAEFFTLTSIPKDRVNNELFIESNKFVENVSNIKNAVIIRKSQFLDIHGMPTYETLVEFEEIGHKFIVTISVMESDKHIHKILGWSLASRKTKAFRHIYQALFSLRQVPRFDDN